MKHFLIISIIVLGLLQNSCHEKVNLKYSDKQRIENDLKTITIAGKGRYYENLPALNFVAQYIYDQFSASCDTVYYQTFIVNGKEYKNVIGSIGLNKKERIVIGAHYDVEGYIEGADDNASSIAGLLELSRLLSKDTLNYRIDFVAFTLEEGPYFRTDKMGSYVHAKSLHDKGIKIKGMICLEMIGYFSDKINSQNYPYGILRFFFGSKGDFIAVVHKFGNGNFGRLISRKMKSLKILHTISFRSPVNFNGLNLSDHYNYWKFGYSAVMITNTAFYRNDNYHKITDRIHTLDINRLSLVVDELYLTVKQMR
jgi:Zn-dependent M28 family amino/carboxypeptidase